MRLTHLMLGRYGHLIDVDLVFPADPGLHVVLGANEAGKSTALVAIGDCLFGFPHRTPFAFLHAARDLRIGAVLRARDGRQGTFFRRKGRKDDLFDERDQPLAETDIAAFLGGATRERFDRVFGLNGLELRRGGDAILKGEGEVGEAIVQAHTGLHGFRALVDRLNNDAGRLFGDRKGHREFHLAVARFTDAKQRLGERGVQPGDYNQKKDERDRLDAARATNGGRRGELHAELSRLHRIRRASPARLALVRACAARADLGTIPKLPADAAARFRDATARRQQAQHDLRREQDREADLQTVLRDLPPDPPVLAEAEAIDVLAEHRQRIAGAERDRETQRVIANQRAAAVASVGRRLGLAEGADTLAARVPSALDRDKVSRALARHERLAGQWSKAQDDLAGVRVRLSNVQAAMAALPEPVPSRDLRAAIDAVRSEGRLHADRTEADTAHQTAQAECERALAALPLWNRDAASLAAVPVPLDALVQSHADELKARADALRRVEARVAAIDEALIELAAEAQADGAIGEPPTIAAIQAARTRRDRAWHLIRRHHLAGGPAPSTAELAEIGGRADLPDLFEALLKEADQLADRRADERERALAVEKRKADEIRQRTLRTAAEVERVKAVADHDAAATAWRALWQRAGIEPLDPAAMREWLQRRGAIVGLQVRALDARKKLSHVRDRYSAALATLATLLPEAATEANGDLPALLEAATRLCRDREQQEEALAKARQTVEAAVTDLRKAERAQSRIEADMAAWQGDWSVTAPVLGLPPDASAEQATPALNLWNEIDTAAHDRQAALDRIDEMSVAIDRFASDARAVASRIAPEFAGSAPYDVVAGLASALAAARLDARRRDEAAGELNGVQAGLRQLLRERDAAERTLACLRSTAGAADDEALQQVILRAGEHHALSQQINEREIELRKLDDGKSLRELATEAEGVDVDALPGRVADLEAELRTIAGEDLANQARVTELRHELATMEAGNDAAGAAQEMHTALSDIEDVAARYVPLRMAHTLLRAGIERFRRQQQDPLLNRAGHIFARLTEGRYDRLGVDEDEGKLVIKACRPDGTECLADRLSDGTLDQLYLALRLAAVESYARTAEPLPFVADDLLVNFDDRRAAAALRVLAEFGKVTQVILFTHHGHVAEMAEAGLASVHRLSAQQAALLG